MNRAWIRAAGIAGLAALVSVACSNSIEGTYETGIYKLELMSGGEAKMSFGPESQDCTYNRADKKITLTCPAPAEPMDIAINDDGSLQAGLIGMMKKTK